MAEDERSGEEPARGGDTDPEEGGPGPDSSEGEEEAGGAATEDHDSGQVSTNEEDIVEADDQEGGTVPQRQEFEAVAEEGPAAPNAEWWETLCAPSGTTPRKTPPTGMVQTEGKAEPQEQKGPTWWKKIRSPLKSTATDAAREREREALKAPEKVIDRDRQI